MFKYSNFFLSDLPLGLEHSLIWGGPVKKKHPVTLDEFRGIESSFLTLGEIKSIEY